MKIKKTICLALSITALLMTGGCDDEEVDIHSSSDESSIQSNESSISESSSEIEIEKTYSLKFESDYCDLENKNNLINDCLEIKENEEVELTMMLKEGFDYCNLPNDIRLYFGINKGIKDTDYIYEINENSASIKFNMTNDIRIEANINDSNNQFKISKQDYENSYGLEGIEYAQFYTRETYYVIDVFTQVHSVSEYFSPNLYYAKATLASDSSSQISTSEEAMKPDEETGDLYNYSKVGDEFLRADIPTPGPMITPENQIINRLYTTFETRDYSIPYSALEEHFVDSRLSYVFDVEYNSFTYNIEMSFYNNHLTYFSYNVIKNDHIVRFAEMKIGYETIIPDINL